MDTLSKATVVDTNPNPMIATDSKEKLNIILFSAGQLVSLLGTYIYSFAISLYILKITGSGTSFAFSILIGTLPRVILSPIAGSLSDRVDRKKLIVGLDFLSGAVVLALLGLSMIYGLQLPFIYAATFLLAVIGTFFNTCFSAAIPRLVTDKNLIKINSYNRAIDSGGSILGPILGGLIFGIVSMKLFLLVNGISFILSAISEMFIDFEFNKPEQREKSPGDMSAGAVWQDIKEVFGFIKGNKLLTLVLPISITLNFFIAASLAVVLPYLINNVLGMTSSQYGAVEGAFSVGMLVAALIVGRLPEKEKKHKNLTLGLAGMGLTMLIMGVPGLAVLKDLSLQIVFGVYLVMAVLFAFFLLYIDIPFAVILQRSIPAEMLGRVMGVLGTIANSLRPLGIILAGISLNFIPAYWVFFITGIYFIGAAFMLYKNKEMQEY